VYTGETECCELNDVDSASEGADIASTGCPLLRLYTHTECTYPITLPHISQPLTSCKECVGSTLRSDRNSRIGAAPVSHAFDLTTLFASHPSPPSRSRPLAQDKLRTNHTPSRPPSQPPAFPFFFLFIFALRQRRSTLSRSRVAPVRPQHSP